MSWFFALIKLLETKSAIDKSEELPSMLFKQGLKRRFATANIPTNQYGKKLQVCEQVHELSKELVKMKTAFFNDKEVY